MTLDEIDSGLPKGFHDAEVSQLAVDFLQKTMTLDLDLWIGRMSMPLVADRETYGVAKLELRGLAYFAVEPPDPKYPYAKPGAITVDLCDVEDGSSLPPIQSGMFASRFFVSEWNAFIIVSASEALLTWTGEPHNHF
ncbi:MAG: hypothetical protein ABSE63_10010 [Thermoguttaceae bacterium]|jgi:hypothetical protein